jgi:asparagine synthase (glutamine-hydrolysing)
MAWDQSPLSWMSFLDLNLRLPKLLLMRVDKMSMATSVEARVPFLDHHFIRHSLGIAPSLKTKGGACPYPRSNYRAKKKGFSVPIDDWVRDELGVTAKETLRDFCATTDFFDPKGIERILAGGDAQQIWCLFNFALWWKEYIRN